jgi:glycosyltransferase involved in cell wall biosynthesis
MAVPLVSVVITTLNEGKNIRDLLESLANQEPPYEVLVVDAGSTDRTVEIVKGFEKEFPVFRLLHCPGSRGTSRNFGVAHAKGDYIAFIDGDCIANAFWLQKLRRHATANRVVAGRSVQIGYWAFDLGRVELLRRGQDITYPSCNLLYPRAALVRIGGFDPRFVTAEDIDLNFRAVEAGLEIMYTESAVVYARSRASINSFLRQAFWNGYGRKQLTLKHGGLWTDYRFTRMLEGQIHFWGMARLAMAVFGYVRCLLRETSTQWKASPMTLPQGVAA